jgi:hypothetical protein
MTPPMPTLRFVLTSIAIAVAVVAILLLYAKACRCDNCKDPWAVRMRSSLQLCRACAVSYDRASGRVRRRRSVLRRIWGRAA